MDHGPQSTSSTDFLRWIAYERDAAFSAKLAILRASRCEDIRYFGECLREHTRHVEELTALGRISVRAMDAPAQARFATTEPFLVGAVADGRTLFDAMERLEGDRIERYVDRHRAGADQATSMLDGLLDRHLGEARARLARLRALRERRRDEAA
jgi:hypothetical protein